MDKTCLNIRFGDLKGFLSWTELFQWKANLSAVRLDFDIFTRSLAERVKYLCK